jgi:hypothetical protein
MICFSGGNIFKLFNLMENASRFFVLLSLSLSLSLSLILLLLSSGRQMKTETEGVSETERAGRLDGIRPFLGQNGPILAGEAGKG